MYHYAETIRLPPRCVKFIKPGYAPSVGRVAEVSIPESGARDCPLLAVHLARFSHQLLGTSCEGTENLDDGLTGMLAKSKKRLRTIAGDDGLVFGSCAP
jgi:hypothetical protein